MNKEELTKLIVKKIKVVKVDPTYTRISELILLSSKYCKLNHVNFDINWNSKIPSKEELHNFCDDIIKLLNDPKNIQNNLEGISSHEFKKKEKRVLYSVDLKKTLPKTIYKIISQGKEYIKTDFEPLQEIEEDIVDEKVDDEDNSSDEEEGYSLYNESSGYEEEFSD